MCGLKWVLVVSLALGLWPVHAGVRALFDPSRPEVGPFPTDALTVADPDQKTGRRVNLPLPDCSALEGECNYTRLLNQLDGFNPSPRMNVRFSAPIDPYTLGAGMFLVSLENLTSDEAGLSKPGSVATVNQVIYDPATYIGYAKPDSALDQHRRYLLVVTDAVRDLNGAPVEADPAFASCITAPQSDYCSQLAAQLGIMQDRWIGHRLVSASLFTTMSATTWLEQARARLEETQIGFQRTGTKSVFDISRIALLTWHQQVGTAANGFRDLSFPLPAALVQGVGKLSFGSFRSPRFLDDSQVIAAPPTNKRVELPAESNEVFFHVFLPEAKMPAAGYPVVIFGHGFNDSKLGGPSAVAGAMARAGFAVVAINAVGHGYGPNGKLRITEAGGTVTELAAGGRGLDLNGDGKIEASEGCLVFDPAPTAFRDCFRQTVVDLMQLVRTIRVGLDMDGDGVVDLDGNRVYYAGQSLGAIYGTILNAVEPNLRAAALNVGGGSIVDVARWSEGYRAYVRSFLTTHHPYLLNLGDDFDDNYVLRYQPAKVNQVWMGCELQNFFERMEWLQASADPLSYAPHLWSSTLPGVPMKKVLWQFAKGDRSVPNPASTALIRAANMRESTQYYRHDLAREVVKDLPANPHPFLAGFLDLDAGGLQISLAGWSIANAAQSQIAGFFDSDGAQIPNANGTVRLLFGKNLFEAPDVLTEQFNW
jgi:hypothetical protein